MLASTRFLAILKKHYDILFPGGATTLRFLRSEQSGSVNQTVLINCNTFAARVGLFTSELRDTYWPIITEEGSPLLQKLQGPTRDSITMHIMLHPSRRLFNATEAEHALFAILYDAYTKHSGYFRGIFLDPQKNEDGTYSVRFGPMGAGCHYPSHP